MEPSYSPKFIPTVGTFLNVLSFVRHPLGYLWQVRYDLMVFKEMNILP